MEDIIYLLPDAVANQIAAGEVVQRPASVVKELLENAVDAGATQVTLIIKDAGKGLIQVVDNGKGMSFNDAAMCFERHATSKLRSAEDLFALRTMGFRGEAMASIAAVAQVEMKTRQHNQEVGTLIQVDGSEILKREATACNAGTSTSVRNLFFNTPVRRNFLKSNAAETKLVLEELQRVALAYPEIAFTVFNNDQEVSRWPGGKLSQRIVDVFGNQYRGQLLPCQEELTSTTVQGYVGKPEFARRTKGDQYLFVNDRFVRSPSLFHAIASAFEGLLPPDTYPFYVVKIKIDPQLIDVNVHPSKTEIKFQDERIVYSVIQIAVKRALATFQIVPSIDFEENINHGFNSIDFSGAVVPPQIRTNHPNPNIPTGNNWQPSHQRTSQQQAENFLKLQAPFRSQPAQVPLPLANPDGINTLHTSRLNQQHHTFPDGSTALMVSSGLSRLDHNRPKLPHLEDQETTGQDPMLVLGRFIVKAYDHGLMLINVRAALERISYERLQRQREHPSHGAQANIFQQTLRLGPADYQLAVDMQEELAILGLVIEPFGSNSIVIRSLPPDYVQTPGSTEASVLEELLELIKQPGNNQTLPYRERMIRSMAKQQASRADRPRTVEAQEELISRLLATNVPHYTPDGRPTMIMLDGDKLEAALKLS